MQATPFYFRKYQHGDVLLNVSGVRDADECSITKITAADSEIDLFDMLPTSTVESIANAIDMQLMCAARQHNAEARAERHQWHREFAIA